MALPLAALAAGSAVASGLSSLWGANKAEDKLNAARARAMQTSKEYGQKGIDRVETGIAEGKDYYDPYRQAGLKSLAEYQQKAREGFQFSQDDPSYQWRFGEGQRALERMASAGAGGRVSGGTLAALQARGQDMASTEYAAEYDRWLRGMGQQWNLANLGYSASGNMANLAFGGAQDVANRQWDLGTRLADYQMMKGNIGAAAAQGRAGALSGAFNMMGGMAGQGYLRGLGGGGGAGAAAQSQMSGAQTYAYPGWQPTAQTDWRQSQTPYYSVP